MSSIRNPRSLTGKRILAEHKIVIRFKTETSCNAARTAFDYEKDAFSITGITDAGPKALALDFQAADGWTGACNLIRILDENEIEYRDFDT